MSKLKKVTVAGGWLLGLYVAQAVVGFVAGVAITLYGLL